MDQINVQEFYIHHRPMIGSGSKFSCMKKGGTEEECKEEEMGRPSPSLSRSLESSPASSRAVSPTTVSLNVSPDPRPAIVKLFRPVNPDETFDQMMERQQLRVDHAKRVARIQKPIPRNVFKENDRTIRDLVQDFRFTKGFSQRKSKK
jgi:hypothetical protein